MKHAHVATDRYAAIVALLAHRSSEALLRLWDGLPSYDVAGADNYHDAAKPFVIAVAQASLDAAVTYSTVVSGHPARTPSALIVPDAAARTYDPFDRLGHLLSEGTPWVEATGSARTVVESLGRDTVFQTTRQGVAETAAAPSGWQRITSGNCCDWCNDLTSVVFSSETAATFGHANCNCIAVPVGSSLVHPLRHASSLPTSTFDPAGSLHNQIETAQFHASRSTEQAFSATAHDRQRAEVRSIEWSTRAERATERLGLLEAA